MEASIQLKNNLIARIKSSKDLKFLKAIQTIFDSSNQELFQLSTEQNYTLQKSREDIKNGKFIKHSKAIEDLEEWIQKK